MNIGRFNNFDDTNESSGESGASLGTYDLQDGVGTCIVSGQDANHDFTDADFSTWAKMGHDEIEDLIVDAIANSTDQDPDDIQIHERRFDQKSQEIYFEWTS